MPTLRQIQQLFTADVLAYAHGRRSDTRTTTYLRVPEGVDRRTRLDVYRHGYPSRIVEALGEAFPATANILGDGSFANLVRRYLAEVDLRSYTLNDVGEQLADHCRSDSLSTALPFLADLVLLEWTVLRAFHANERDPVDPASLATYDMEDWESAVLEFQPSVAVVESKWPIADLRDTVDVDRSDISTDLEDRPQTVVVRRRGFDVDIRVLDRDEARALDLLRGGVPLGRTIETLGQSGQSPEDIMKMFGNWVACGLIAAIGVDRG